jgi:hypothetical protein
LAYPPKSFHFRFMSWIMNASDFLSESVDWETSKFEIYISMNLSNFECEIRDIQKILVLIYSCNHFRTIQLLGAIVVWKHRGWKISDRPWWKRLFWGVICGNLVFIDYQIENLSIMQIVHYYFCYFYIIRCVLYLHTLSHTTHLLRIWNI